MTTGPGLRLGLISDTHIPEAMPQLWPHVYDLFDGCDGILHAGDIHDVHVIDELARRAPVWGARGNGDDGSGGREVQPEHPSLQETWWLEFEGVHVAMIHAAPVPERPPHLRVEKTLDRLFPDRPHAPHVIIHGDTHVEDIRTVDGILCVNPGSPTYPHNLTVQYGTVGFLDIADGQVEASIWRINETGIEPFDWETWGRPW
ncbi:MAG: metallophosphoesterase family protein [Actinomycetia bacterium]|nr:metallophosphoesterase family protein [Actinomycetes bacterium]MCP3911988.1 metallophosphoesterase family protein [Actinomycetes bacterium]MCP4083493.1 metallophosphoesterase family protein [Actinomycetes bacterium]